MIDQVPEVGKRYHFFDDGKKSYSRQYYATVKRVITKEEAKEILLPFSYNEEFDNFVYDNEYGYIPKSIYELWENARNACKSDYIYPHDDEGYWCYAKDTDYFIECEITRYDDKPIWFARHINGSWFSFETTDSWQCGMLDVDDRFNEYWQLKEEEKND